ncbi:Nicotinate-nucleotide--dimethylbenzimidazole phosphoribosyltransferase OS=Tsukamurella paurometabola(strain ATCC 8368 / DSM / CCUG 35730 / CIP 100753 /JCM 10117 / KCTC 9821 / NBRC 16120 / NCIMB 702349 / NCTC 13040)OX=521096 GN=cobT PE=3 SV=1 [Tsukamurella paurometabola]|uniref:Nicotinate-nucleotide--dimethylbenzimidazole phosphoribosyltransferase n=1 Tax=Tsukamurella paurometabola (strain ATCC 8368 / DSM 20162 / CCUG 35730 / CIP 100753 / JCM 10117 / KCTC 9821 / NBRC 16120 / NCIMB 702349 / NCTC 13040) TaxID=521096 RepID=D5UXQ8_TSUPD|nr:nicotinate-nucleotide--dimethylbenzimidazole phosphoribosyltransferase [Tsukamurella paurometabola]ADG78150.1 nicotinate-nucleotide/dimethylbenzimidazolephosp horibosyltransferase [Tsukamurella paurometabola DSM 20162]SUP30417.1 Nicotinate-nucleotide--dimethylbenzimidazole phosphoribosyltransferase [Tsukamurella paurometabola]
MGLRLVLGGVRSGKSARAEQLITAAAGSAAVRYVATAPRPDGDPDLASRIDAHRSRRPQSWTTVETQDLAALFATGDVATLVDDLGAWLAARLDAAGWESPARVDDEVAALVNAAAAYRGELVFVSPEVGLSVVPATHAGRVFQDLLGDLNARLAAVADGVELVVAGRAVVLDGRAGPAPAPAPATATAAPAAPAAPVVALAPVELPPFDPDADPLSFPSVTPPDASVAQQARDRQLQLTKPKGSLGRLEELGEWIAACQGTCPPRQFERARIVVMAGDHGVAATGVSAYPPEVTAQMVANFAADGAAVNVLATQAGASVRVEDIAVSADTSPELSRNKIRRSSGDIATADALSDEETIAAIAAGRRIADEEIDSGADLLILGDMGIGNTTPAAVLIGAITDTEPVLVVGRGTGIDDNAWMRKAAAVRDAMYRARPHAGNPKALLRTAAGADLAAMAGFLAQAAVRRTPVILDGVVVTAAALVAHELAPGAIGWWVAGHRSPEPAHDLALRRLDLEPLVDLGMRLGEGSGATLALPIVRSAVAVLGEMATFDSAGVSRA